MNTFDKLENHLALRSFISGYHITLADLFIWGALKSNAIFGKNLKNGEIGENLTRWFYFVGSLNCVQEAINALNKYVESTKVKKDQGSFDIGLKDAEMGKVCTRFLPEPSGYLHVGHAKAALLNQYFAKRYNGKLIVRFDDTNPSKEKEEFEESIKEDLKLIGIEGDVCTHTSDHFDTIYNYAIQIIKDGKAYVDDTDRDTMRQQRGEGIPSKCRDLPVEENLRRFEEMKNGTEFGLKCCLRAKISVDNKNKALRDPVIYRCNLLPHHQNGDKWKIYPTYDFACPIVDSIEGVTHALRTVEYRDRNPQYEWFLKNLNLRWVHIWDCSRMNFVYTLLSKRKLQWFVDQGLVTGWDDPRFPTIRGIRRRGMTIEALRTYILMQGASQKDLMLEWDKLWAINKKVIDPVAPRYAALEKEKLVEVNILDDFAPSTKDIPRHKKNPDVGIKTVNYSNKIYLEFADVAELQDNEEFTLMYWGNAIVKKINWNADHTAVDSMDIVLHLEGDFKKIKKKVTWLSRIASNGEKSVVDVTLLNYDYLITKRKLEEDDEVKDFITPVTEFKKSAVGDISMASLKKGDIIQIERKDYYIVDKAYDGTSLDIISIPDGKAGKMASKADTGSQKNEKKEKKDKKEKKEKKSSKKEKKKKMLPQRMLILMMLKVCMK
jgi:glutamyl-tRNA synthetase